MAGEEGLDGFGYLLRGLGGVGDAAVGVEHVVAKPFDLPELLDLVRRLLGAEQQPGS